MVRRGTQTLKKYLRLAGYVRWSRAFLALLLLTSSFIPVYLQISDIKAYALTPETKKVIGSASKNLSAKFSFDKENDKWQFNKNGVAALASSIAKQQGGKDAEDVASALTQLAAKQVGGSGKKDTSLYSVDLPTKASEGITYYDNVTHLSFTMVPSFSTRDGRLSHDRIIYPFADGQIIYTAKNDGLKEDIVLAKNTSDSLSYSYTLKLPETLEARAEKDGSIGVYSADPALFGNISFGSDEDKARVMEGRKNGHKEHLVFNIPAPFIKDQQGRDGHTRYSLKGSQLTVHASGLKNLSYPLTIDPSVTITSASDFSIDANDESNADFGQNGDLKRGGLTGGAIGSWTTQTAIPASGAGACPNSSFSTSGVHNGYFYIVCNNSVTYAKLNTDGTINGSWQAGAAPDVDCVGRAGFIYNGYLYLTGGQNGTGAHNTTYYLKLNADGTTAASWSAGPNLNTGRYLHGAVAYNGYAYVAGGAVGTLTQTDTVEKAEIRGDGSLGSWTTTGTTALTAARREHQTEVYNGYMYVTGGLNGGNEIVEFARINSDGTMGSWNSTTTIPTGSNNPFRRAGSAFHNGYWYLVGGCDGSCTATSNQKVIYAPVYATGQIGDWRQGTTLPSQRTYTQVGFYNNYIFNADDPSDGAVYSSPIDPAGSISSFTATNDFNTTNRVGLTSVAAAGYLYEFGGKDATTATNTVRYAAINSDGTVGTWSATNSFTDARFDMSIETYGTSIYLIGGEKDGAVGTNCTQGSGSRWFCPDVQRATINTSTGALTWSGTYTYSTTARSGLGSAIVGEYLYVIGGLYDNSGNVTGEVNVAPLNANGTVGTFSTTLSLDTARHGFDAAAWGGRIYAVAGTETRNTEVATINASDGTISDWSTTGADVSGGTGTGLEGLEVVANSGYLYATGGRGTSTGFLNTVQIARVNSDGSLGSWSTSGNTFTNGRWIHASTAYNGYLYVLGGCNDAGCPASGTSYKDVQFTRITNGGSGATGTWANKGSFTTARTQASVASYNGYVYLTGGCTTATSIVGCTTSTDDSRYSQVAPDGSLAWSTLTTAGNVPTSRYGHTSVAYNGYLYVMGGCSSTGGTNGFCTTFLNDVQRVKLNADGNTTGNSWTTSSALSLARYGAAATVYKGYLYVTGGCGGSASGGCNLLRSTTDYAQINSDGSLGSWATTGGSFSSGRFLLGAVAYAGKLYVAAGCASMPADSCTSIRADVQYATINSDGTVSSTWNIAGNFPTSRFGASLTAQNGRFYITGGCSASSAGACTTFQGDTSTAPVSASGALGAWQQQINAFTDARYGHAGALANGNLYLFGGMKTGPTLLADSMGSALQQLARIGQYSKLVTVTSATDVAYVYYNGTVGDGTNLQYKVAPSSGVFGSAIAGVFGTGSEPTPLCQPGTIYYIQVSLTVDDSTNAVFGDDNVTTVSDIMVYYRLNATPPPNLRLNGGKWFSGETQQALDICKT